MASKSPRKRLELTQRCATIFREINLDVTRVSPLLMEYGFRQQSQFRLKEMVRDEFSSIASYEAE